MGPQSIPSHALVGLFLGQEEESAKTRKLLLNATVCSFWTLAAASSVAPSSWGWGCLQDWGWWKGSQVGRRNSRITPMARCLGVAQEAGRRVASMGMEAIGLAEVAPGSTEHHGWVRASVRASS